MNAEEIQAVIDEENAAMLEFSEISKQETELTKQKGAARTRLMLARAAKRDMIDYLMQQ